MPKKTLKKSAEKLSLKGKKLPLAFYIHKTATVEEEVYIGEGTRVWHQAQIRRGSRIGTNCIIGKSAFIDFDTEIGNNCKIQNHSLIYHKTILENGVFIGPNVCLANDKTPRAINPDGTLKKGDDWEASETLIKKGAALGASTVVTPGVTIGSWAMSGSGSVITKNIPDHALVYGNPARVKDFVCKCGKKLQKIGENNEVVVTKCSCGEELVIPKEIYKLKEDNKGKKKVWIR